MRLVSTCPRQSQVQAVLSMEVAFTPKASTSQIAQGEIT
jgi:hypothetical protein